MHHPNKDHQSINRSFMLSRRGLGERGFRFGLWLLATFAPPSRVPDLRRLPFDLSATQRGQKRQSPNATAPRQLDQQHHREPFQAETFDGVFVTGPDRIAVTAYGVDAPSSPSLNRVIRANDDSAISRQQEQQQAEQNPAHLQSTPAGAIEHSMITPNNKTLTCSQTGLVNSGWKTTIRLNSSAGSVCIGKSSLAGVFFHNLRCLPSLIQNFKDQNWIKSSQNQSLLSRLFSCLACLRWLAAFC